MPTMNIDTPMPLEIAWPESKNNSINYLGEIFEMIMGEALNSKSRVNGAGFESKDQCRLTDLVESLVLPLIKTPPMDTPVLTAASYAPEDVDGKSSSKKA
jgi:hypothetical protein